MINTSPASGRGRRRNAPGEGLPVVSSLTCFRCAQASSPARGRGDMTRTILDQAPKPEDALDTHLRAAEAG